MFSKKKQPKQDIAAMVVERVSMESGTVVLYAEISTFVKSAKVKVIILTLSSNISPVLLKVTWQAAVNVTPHLQI
jgi:hypothetical protein